MAPLTFRNEDEEAQYCLSTLRDGTRDEKIVARERLAAIFARRGLYEEAAELYELNVRAGVRSPEIFEQLSETYRHLGDHASAEAALEEARRVRAMAPPPATPEPVPAPPPPPEATDGQVIPFPSRGAAARWTGLGGVGRRRRRAVREETEPLAARKGVPGPAPVAQRGAVHDRAAGGVAGVVRRQPARAVPGGPAGRPARGCDVRRDGEAEDRGGDGVDLVPPDRALGERALGDARPGADPGAAVRGGGRHVRRDGAARAGLGRDDHDRGAAGAGAREPGDGRAGHVRAAERLAAGRDGAGRADRRPGHGAAPDREQPVQHDHAARRSAGPAGGRLGAGFSGWIGSRTRCGCSSTRIAGCW